MSRGEKGQMTIEAILIATILVSVTLYITKTARNERLVAGLVEGPWQPIRGMIEDGVWVKAGKSKANHPSIFGRHTTFRGDDTPPN